MISFLKYILTIKKHYEENKTELLAIHAQKFICNCGGQYTKGHTSRHLKSKKHIKYLESLTN